VIGGYAVGYHGYPRATGDIDIWIQGTRGNTRNLVKAIQEFGFDVPDCDESIFLQKKNIIRMGQSPIRIEIFTAISGVTFNKSFLRKKVSVIDGIRVNFISLDDLKKNKKASGRYKDLDDLKNLP
jgi:predicted nucleotidyltransferase